jgi:hypothetical protein
MCLKLKFDGILSFAVLFEGSVDKNEKILNAVHLEFVVLQKKARASSELSKNKSKPYEL